MHEEHENGGAGSMGLCFSLVLSLLPPRTQLACSWAQPGPAQPLVFQGADHHTNGEQTVDKT